MVRRCTTATSSSSDSDNVAITEIRAALEELHYSNQILQGNILTFHQQCHEDNLLEDDEILEPRSVFDENWGTSVLENFKPPSSVTFDGKSTLRNTLLPSTHCCKFN